MGKPGAANAYKQLHDLTAAVLHHSTSRGTELVVLLAIAHHARRGVDGRWTAYPGVRRLAHYANVSERAVQLALHKLVGSGELIRLVNAGGTDDDLPADRRPNLYVIADPCPPNCDRSPSHRVAKTARDSDIHRRPNAQVASADQQRAHAGAARAALRENQRGVKPASPRTG